MTYAKIIALLGVLAMGAMLIYSFAVGDFGGEGGELLSMPWGLTSIVDIYTGISLFSLWVVYRERSLPRSLAWIASFIVLGFFSAALYTLIALQGSQGDWQRFWMGQRAPQEAR
ncbi:MAG: DUF1475 family protein [Chloroflexia bacterium]|nr:DUF1475 family protein [Chloroflexia bacterium]